MMGTLDGWLMWIKVAVVVEDHICVVVVDGMVDDEDEKIEKDGL